MSGKNAKKGEKVPPKKEIDLEDVGVNPYVAVLNKKIRSLNKKLEKVKTIEAAVAEGKPINAEQRQVSEKKEQFLHTLEDYESIRTSLATVALEEKNESGKEAVTAVSTESNTETIKVETKDESTSAVTKTVDASTESSGDKAVSSDALEVLFAALHVAKFAPSKLNAHASVDNAVLFVVNTLLGNTFSPEASPKLPEVVATSVSHASKLVTHSTDTVGGNSYAEIAHRVLELLKQKPAPKAAAPAPVPVVIEPTFDFMVESKLNIAVEAPVKAASPKVASRFNAQWGDEPSPSNKAIAAPATSFVPALALEEPAAPVVAAPAVPKLPAWGNPLGASATLMGGAPLTADAGKNNNRNRKPRNSNAGGEKKEAGAAKSGERPPRKERSKSEKGPEGGEGGEKTRPPRERAPRPATATAGGEGKPAGERGPRREGDRPRGPPREGNRDGPRKEGDKPRGERPPKKEDVKATN